MSSLIFEPASFYEDIDSARLIVQIQLQDALEMTVSRKGKGRADSQISDEEYAFELQKEELTAWQTLHEDAQIAKSIKDALELDRGVLDAYLLLEEVEAADHRAALALSRGSALPAQTASQRHLESRAFTLDVPLKKSKDENPELTRHFSALSTGSQAKAGPSVDQYRKIQCISCTDSFRAKDTLQATCEHQWCRTCLKDVVQVYLRDESLHPVRCCQNPIPPEDVIRHLSAVLANQYQVKRHEYEVSARYRVYCALPTCSSFLGSSEGLRPNATLTCLRCQTRTCPSCQKVAHDGDDCMQNTAAEEVRALAKTEKWQTCPGCSSIVELDHGCYHMTCRCRAEFCYLCGARWKHCACEQWDEPRLLATAQRRVENELGAQVRIAQPVVFQREVRRAAQELRVNHDCAPHIWKNHPGGGLCEECYHHLPLFLKICRNCSLLVCRRCSLNRV